MLFHYILLPLTITLAGAETSLRLLPSSFPSSHPLVPLPPTRCPVGPLCLPSTTACVPHPPFYYLEPLSLRTEGIYSRNSLLRGLFCCNRCSPLACTPFPFFPFSFFLFGQTCQTHCSCETACRRGGCATHPFLNSYVSFSYVYKF